MPTLARLKRLLRPAQEATPTYDKDHLRVWHKSTEFLEDPAFQASYAIGMNSGHKICRPKGSNQDIHIEWRIHVSLWAAWHAKQLPGDFVECGVNTGMLSLAICNYIDFNATDKSFWLFDTFRGIPESQVSDAERAKGRLDENVHFYEECYDLAKRNFEPYPKAHLVRGMVPDTLDTVDIDQVCYLSIDMNIAKPEVDAIEHFWPKLVTGAVVVLDDYGWLPYIEQKHAMDAFADRHGVKILTVPTGQGLLFKP